MKTSVEALILAATLLISTGSDSNAAEPTVHLRDLANGIRVVVAYFPESTNASIFTFAPLGLANDAKDQAQWSHLVEHLVIHSTIPEMSPEANAETLPDHMRFDFYGNIGNWRQGMTHHRKWLEGTKFTQPSLEAEKPKVMAECDYTAKNFATHKFAVAAWSQALRFGLTNVALKGDVRRARLADLQELRSLRLAVSNEVTVCVTGGVNPSNAFHEVEKQMGGVSLRGVKVPSEKFARRNLEVTWDLDARHLLMLWAIPSFREDDYPALLTAVQSLNQMLFSDEYLKNNSGMIYSGADVVSPQGTFFYISAALKPEANIDAFRKAVIARVEKLSGDQPVLSQGPMVASYLARQMTTLPSMMEIKAQIPAGMDRSMVEGNIGLQFAMNVHRYGNDRVALTQRLGRLTAADIKRAIEKYLKEDEAMSCLIHPQRQR